MRILELLPDPHHDVPKMETAMKLYYRYIDKMFFTFFELEKMSSQQKFGLFLQIKRFLLPIWKIASTKKSSKNKSELLFVSKCF